MKKVLLTISCLLLSGCKLKDEVSLFGLHAFITSSEVKLVTLHRHGHMYHDWRLCANFDIYLDGTKTDSSFQCGTNWDDINYGIRYQLQQIRQKEQNKRDRETYIERLKRIKDDEVGYTIRS